MEAQLQTQKLQQSFLISVLVIMLSYTALATVSVTAVQAKSLTEVFTTDAFTGTWEVFSKFNFLGMIMNYIISAFSLFGLFLVAWQRFATLLYLSGRSLFDRIHEIKESAKGTKIFGLEGLLLNPLKDSSKYGTGIDAIMSFFMSLCPDMKAASDYAETGGPYNLTENDSVTTYVLKISIPTIMTIFFFTIGFSGTFFQIYGNVVEAMATATDHFVDTKLSTYVDRLINKGAAYKFAYEDDGSNVGKLRQNIAESMYTQVIKNITNPTSDATLLIGKQIDDIVSSDFTAEAISAALGSVNDNEGGNRLKWDGSEDTATNVQFSVVVNANSQAFSGEVSNAPYNLTTLACGFPIGSSFANDGGIGYVHVIFSKKSNSIEHNYFATPNEKSNNSSGKNAGNAEQIKE